MVSRRVDNVKFEIPHHLTITGTQHAVDLQPMSRMFGHPVDAVLGGDMLDKLTVAILTSEQTLLLLPSGSAKFKDGAITLPLVDGNKVEATLENQPVKLKVDLGSNGLVSLNEQGWRRVIWADKPVEDMQHGGAEGMMVKGRQSLHHEMKLGPISAHDVTVVQNHATPDTDEDGRLGEALLANFDMVLDVSAKTLTLIPLKPPVAPAAAQARPAAPAQP